VRNNLNAARLVAVLVLSSALLVACNMLPGAAEDLKVGDCFDLPTETSDIEEVQHRPCNEPHDAEVIAVLTHPAGPDEAYPVISGFGDYVEENCLPAFESYTGRDFASAAELDVGYLHPTLLGWGEGDRGFSCHALRLDGAKLAASVRAAP
jgi:predicted small secreted protein